MFKTNNSIRKINRHLVVVLCLILSVVKGEAQGSYYDISPINGNTSFSYTQVPEQLVSQVAAIGSLSGITFQWKSSASPVSGFTPISGATSQVYTFPAALSATTYYQRVTSGSVISGVLGISNTIKIQVVSANWENINYVREHDILVAGQSDWKTIDSLAIGSKLQTTTYMDGLGRPVQKVSRETALQDPAQPGNLWGDMVQFSSFDVLGRQNKKYLPYTTTNQSGKLKTAPLTDQPAYYTNRFNETAAYSQVSTYDNSPLNRALKVNESGTNWTNSAGSLVNYDLNTATDLVQNFTIGYNGTDLPISSGVYPVNSLFKTTYTDENGKLVIDYTNNSGQLILKKVQLDDAPADFYTGWICTYSVYDDFGQLRFRIQPEAVKWLAANSWNFTATNGQTVADEWCFSYQYDAKGRTIQKKAPGAKPLMMLYDIRDRVVFMQDGNQRLKSPAQWTANLYDELDRPIITTLYQPAKTAANLQTDIDNSFGLIANTASFTTSPNPAANGVAVDISTDTRNTAITNYQAQNSITFLADAGGNFASVANDNFVAEIIPPTITTITSVIYTAVFQNPIGSSDLANTGISTILKYFYYDNYSYAAAKPFNTSFDNGLAYTTSDPIAPTQRTTNHPTGVMVRVLNSATFLTTSFYYDEKGRPIQSTEDNIKGGTDVITNQYQWDGRLLSSASRHTVPNGYTNFAIVTKNIFDKIGRVTSIQKKIGTNDFKTIGTYDLDDMGRLKTKHLDPGYVNTTTGKSELESLGYSYNIHNQITGINKDYALKTAGTYSKWGNYFGLCLGFDKTESVFAGTLLNGQVNGTVWNTQGDDAQRKFDFTYDNAGRLTNAAYKERQNLADAWSNTTMDFSTSGYNGKIQYDLNGNLLAMLQKGVVPGNNTPVTMDDLRYAYAGFSNKLTKVTDMGTLGDNNGKLGDFADGTNTGDDYVYDDNGNLIIDLNKNATGVTGGVTTPLGTSGIRYNFLDKPEEIKITGKGTISMVYDADGNKLQKLFTKEGAATTSVTTYINQFIYQQASTDAAPALQFINFEEGRLRVMQAVSQNNGFDYLTIDGNADMPNTMRGAWDFFVRDYQGNVRMILTEESHTGSNSCTMETARAANEEPVFGQVDVNGVPTAANEVKARFLTSSIPGQGSTSTAGWANNTSAYVARVGNLAGKKVGPNVLMKVMAGDEISASSMYYYQSSTANTTTGTTIVSDLLTSLVQAISGSGSTSSVLKPNASAINTQLSGNASFNTITDPDKATNNETIPKAYLTMVFFDERFNVVAENSISKRVSQPGANAPNLLTPNQKAPKNGYCIVYVSNSSDEMVYFDNLQVTNKHARIIEENHYYAYGLKIAGISSRKMPDLAEGSILNKYLYNDKELIDDADLNWYDYGFRSYDPQIGRFSQLDPLTDEYSQLTPYQYASCDPIENIDIDGLEGGSAVSFSYDVGKYASDFSLIAPRVSAAAASNGLKIGTSLAVNLLVNSAKTGAQIASEKATNALINKAFEVVVKNIIKPAGGAAVLFVFLILSPDFDTWGKSHNEFPESHYSELRKLYNLQNQPKYKTPDNKDKNKSKIFYVTYTKTLVKPDGTTTVYSGRTSGLYTGDIPTDIDADVAVTARESGHFKLNEEGYPPAIRDKFSPNKAAIRGREQNLIDYNGGARSEKGKSRNMIRGVGRHNPERFIYYGSAADEFGVLKNNNPADK